MGTFSPLFFILPAVRLARREKEPASMRIAASFVRLPILLALTLASGLAPGCAAKRSPDAVAEFAAGQVRCADLRTFAAQRRSEFASRTASDVVQDYAVHQLLVAEARRTGLASDPEVAARFRAVRRELLLESSESSLVSDIEVSDADVAAYYEQQGGARGHAARAHTRLILRSLPPNAPRGDLADEQALLRDVVAQFLSGASFADLAVRYSEHESAAQGGALDSAAQEAMGPEFARVIAGLEQGEVSDVVRLPQGLALVLLDGVDAPGAAVPFEDVALEMRGRLLQERRAERAAAALTEARAAFAASIDDTAIVSTAPGYADLPVARIGEETLTLRDLGLEKRPPFLRDAVQRAVDDELLVRLAEQRADERTRAELERRRADLVATIALERLVRSQVPPVREGELMARYATDKSPWSRPEQRVFEVVRVAAESGNLQEARAAADAIARIWRPGGPIHQRNRAEVWGPISAPELADATSAGVAAAAFALDVGATSVPLLVEPGRGIDDFSYVLVRVHTITPEGVLSYDEAYARMVDEVETPRLATAEARMRLELLQRAQLKILPPMFECELGVAAAAATAGGDDPSAPGLDDEAE
jgi:hypothetical protein